jgi:hypothetical protein
MQQQNCLNISRPPLDTRGKIHITDHTGTMQRRQEMKTKHAVKPTAYEQHLVSEFVKAVLNGNHETAISRLGTLSYCPMVAKENADLYLGWYRKVIWAEPKRHPGLLNKLADAWKRYA